jgi:ABC-type phosphate/phosphonate transport system substrate-binding protein
MTDWIANARMYAVSPEVETAWRRLLARVAEAAGVALTYIPYPAPHPLEHLWARPDLGCVFMCGYPIAMRLANVTPIAAPIPAADWAQGRAAYRTDFIARKDSGFATLADAFKGRFGWTTPHSHSGFNAPRHHLLAYRKEGQERVFAHTARDLVTARRVLDCVVAGDIDVGPLDAYWHHLLRQHQPGLVADIRVLESTELAPIPALVAAASMPADSLARLRRAFVNARQAPWFASLAKPLAITGFAAVTHVDFALTLEWDREALAAGYPLPE